MLTRFTDHWSQETFDIGPFYVTLQRQTKFATRSRSAEIDPPYRKGYGFGILIVGTWAVVVGLWRKQVTRPEDDDYGVNEAFNALHAHEITTATAEEIAQW